MNRMMTWTNRLILTLFFLALIATNVLTLTNAAFSAAVSGLMSTALGVQTVSDVLRSKVDAKKKIIKNRKLATRNFGTKVTARTKKLVATTLAEIPGQAIPCWAFRYYLPQLPTRSSWRVRTWMTLTSCTRIWEWLMKPRMMLCTVFVTPLCPKLARFGLGLLRRVGSGWIRLCRKCLRYLRASASIDWHKWL